MRRLLKVVVRLLLVAVAALTLHAQLPRGVLFSDNFEAATNVSPYTIAQQQTNASF